MQWTFLLLFLFLVSCSSVAPFLLPSGGTNVAANTQLGKNNTQTIGTTEVKEQQTQVETVQGDVKQSSDENVVSTEKIDSFVLNQGPDFWYMVLLIVGWLLPSPGEIGRSILRLFGKTNVY